ncbi:hypothetical protein F5X99DRAFT_429445 [Biscogniauxia marginata]|nr:hypothetical protein F5X99DRAFT_429445 [Biscogniauxia marginata]
MRASTLSDLTTISTLAGLVHSRSVPVQSSQIQYCGGADEPTIATSGDPVEGPGIWVTNNDNDPNVKYFVYETSRDEHPWKYLDIPQGSRAFIQVCPTFQGRVMRGTAPANLDGAVHSLGTWIEFALGGGTAWGDISFLEGCDGGASIAATDGSGASRACAPPGGLLVGAPAGALVGGGEGNLVLGAVVEKAGAPANRAAFAWLSARCDASQVYIQEQTEAVISSADGRFDVVFVDGVA